MHSYSSVTGTQFDATVKFLNCNCNDLPAKIIVTIFQAKVRIYNALIKKFNRDRGPALFNHTSLN